MNSESQEKKQLSEEEVLQYWTEKNIFQQSLDKPNPQGDFVFYDGPPFATGTPHYGHLPSSFLKDVVPRFWTMKGYRVERRWGWDCHGLPIENIVEKELGFKTKKEIEAYGIDKFNELCRSKVLEYATAWEKTIPRLGRWADMTNPYKTMDLSFMESVWWVFKQLWDKDLIYQDYKSMHVCPRCETTLSQQEVSEGYKDIKDLSVTAKFELVDEPGTFILAWTTTPWTLPGNVALALGEKIDYVKIQSGEEKFILAKELVEKVFEGKEYQILEEIKAKSLIGKKYQPLFDDYLSTKLENQENIYTIIAEDFITTEDGTGVVHIAPAFGQDDMNAGKKNNLPFIQHVKMDGHITDEVKSLAGLSVKPIDDHQSTDVEIIKQLAAKNLLFAKAKYEHSYPHCWRCDTPLINYATSSWFVNVVKIHKDLTKNAKHINWSPVHIKEGRFGKWLEGARDWSISRQRFWASVMPIWRCEECKINKVYGSVAELEKDSGQKITDLHKHIIDQVTVPCAKCGKQINRVPDVLDTWFDSGSMPFAQLHYPFENKDRLESNFPAQFIAEGIDQTRAWFYYLHVIGTAIKNSNAFSNVIVNGIVLAEDGKKMSKRLKNYPDLNLVVEKYGADALRYYMMTSPVVEADNINFSEDGVKESLQKNVMLLGNVLNFYLLYKKQNDVELPKTKNVLDQWILAKLEILTKDITDNLEKYNIVKASRPISEFINELSTWYVRRSRDRFSNGDELGVQTLGYVLQKLAKLIAPFMPFVAEKVYLNISKNKESVHLEDWPKYNKKLVDEKTLTQMELARNIVEKALAARHEAQIKIRQPLASYTTSLAKKLDEQLVELVLDELNIKELKFGDKDELDVNLTEELKEQGLVREVSRQIQALRKELGLKPEDKVVLYQNGLDNLFNKFSQEIMQATNVSEVKNEQIAEMKEVAGGKIGINK